MTKKNHKSSNKEIGQQKNWRKVTSVILLVLGSILIPFAVLAIWLHSTILNTDVYVNTVAPLSYNQDIDNNLATVITNKLFEKVNVSSQVGNSLPNQGQFLIPPLTDRVYSFTQTQIAHLLGTEEFNKLWIEVNRISHTQIVKLLTGGGEVVQSNNGQVTINLEPVINEVKTRLSNKGVDIFNNVSFTPQETQFTIVQSPQLAQAQTFVNILNQLVYVLPILIVVFFIFAFITSYNRIKTTIYTGIGFILAGLVLLITVYSMRSWYINLNNKVLTTPSAASVFYDTMTRFLLYESWIVVLIGFVLIAAYFVLRKQPKYKI